MTEEKLILGEPRTGSHKKAGMEMNDTAFKFNFLCYGNSVGKGKGLIRKGLTPN